MQIEPLKATFFGKIKDFSENEQHPDPKLIGIFIPSNCTKVLSSDGSNFYFRVKPSDKWQVTKLWSPAMHQVLYGNPSHYINHIIPYNDYIARYCVYKKTPIGEVPVYITCRARL